MVEIALGTALAAIGAGVAIGFAGLGSGLGQGMAAAGSVGAVAEDNDMFARGIIFSALPETQAIYGFLVAILLLVFSGLLGGGQGLPTEAGIVAIGVGASIGFAGLGSGMGQGMAAAGSVGAVAEDNDMFARGIIFSALPETQAIYGFLIAILLLVFSGLLGGGSGLSTTAGIVAIGVGASIGFAGLGSGMGQGIAAASSVGAIVEDTDMFARGIIFSALPETQAIYGFLIAILLMVFGGILA
jgi:V/A-type H+-transporting ATPase subunit K